MYLTLSAALCISGANVIGDDAAVVVVAVVVVVVVVVVADDADMTLFLFKLFFQLRRQCGWWT